MTTKKTLLFLIFLFVTISSVAQTTRVDSLSKAWKNSALSDSLQMDALRNLVFEYVYINPDSAIHLGKIMLAIGDSLKDQRTQVRALRRIGLAYETEGILDSAKIYFQKSLWIRKKMADPALIATGFSDIAGFHSTTGNHDSVLYFYEKALSIFKENNNLERISGIYNNIGITYYDMGQIRKAIDYYYWSMKIDQELGDKNGVAISQSNIGVLYYQIRELDKALEYFQKVLEYHKKDSLTAAALNVIGNIAGVESERGNYDLALQGYTEVLERYRLLGIKPKIASALMDRGLVYSRMKNYENAILDLELSLKVRNESGLPPYPMTLANLGEAYFQQGRIDDAIFTSNKALKLSEELNSMKDLINSRVAFNTLYKAYKEKDDWKKALSMHEKYLLYKDSLQNDETRRLMMNQEYGYKYEQEAIKDSMEMMAVSEAKLADQKLSYEKRINRFLIIGGILLLSILFGIAFYRNGQKAQEAILKQQVQENKMKAIRAQFKPHFISNLQMAIQNFIDKENITMAKKYLDLFSGLMRGILENSDKELVSVSEELEVVEKYMELHKLLLVHPFQYNLIVDQSVNSESVRMPPNILQPLVENAIKHGIAPLDRTGLLSIQVEKVDGFMNFSVEDDGVGRSSNGNWKAAGNGSSFGSKLVKDQLEVIEKQSGKPCSIISVDLKKPDGTPAGTRIEIKIPAEL